MSFVVAETLQFACGRIVASRDLIAAIIVHRDALLVFAAAVLILARVYLYFLAPGWALHIAVTDWLATRRTGPRSNAGRSPP